MFAKYSPLGLFVSMLPLYAGPLLAGWMGAPVAMLLALAAMFFLAQLGAGKEKRRGNLDLTPFLVMLGGAQLLVVTIVFGAGALLRLAVMPLSMPSWVPLTCTALGAVVFAIRYRHDPAEAEMLEALDDAIEQIESMTPEDDGEDRSER